MLNKNLASVDDTVKKLVASGRIHEYVSGEFLTKPVPAELFMNDDKQGALQHIGLYLSEDFEDTPPVEIFGRINDSAFAAKSFAKLAIESFIANFPNDIVQNLTIGVTADIYYDAEDFNDLDALANINAAQSAMGSVISILDDEVEN
ncbi:hypothetical protein J4N45_10065 [Vibrio sp. SCSIO 43140]|uniref:hypothetical protein n=1 Tax=Vibrio sp. SCSIO 43140 TaxID=2819100 RepID=UPI0020763828|nr:hypothetical protein [Vibrio sp. SCSIO 43140]USD58874.1 hypothetical protein J4N45_10065 [Vibrio sp. SCSIO 43140]